MWHSMSRDMKGLYEVRVRNRNTLYRLFCILDSNGAKYGLGGPALVLVSGGTKPMGQDMPSDVYADAIEYRNRYTATTPRPVVR